MHKAFHIHVFLENFPLNDLLFVKSFHFHSKQIYFLSTCALSLAFFAVTKNGRKLINYQIIQIIYEQNFWQWKFWIKIFTTDFMRCKSKTRAKFTKSGYQVPKIAESISNCSFRSFQLRFFKSSCIEKLLRKIYFNCSCTNSYSIANFRFCF